MGALAGKAQPCVTFRELSPRLDTRSTPTASSRAAHWLLYLISCAFLLFGPGRAHAGDAVFVAAAGTTHQLNHYLQVLEDPAGKLSLPEVVARRTEFRSLQQVRTGDYTSTVYWFRVTIDFSSYGEPYSYFIKEFQHLGRLTLYYHDGDELVQQAVDETRPHADRLISLRNYLFRIPTPTKAGPTTYYFKLEPRGHRAQVEVSWSSANNALEQTGQTQLWLGLVFGAVIALCAYNLFLWWFTRYRPYAYYVYYLGCFTLVMADLNGFPSQISTLSPEFTRFFVLCLYGTMHGGIRFTKGLFELHAKVPMVHRYLTVCEWGLAAGAIYALFAPVGSAYQVPVYFIPPCLIGGIVAGLIRWRQGFEPAKYFSIGWLIYGTATLAFCFQIIGILPASKITTYIVQAGAVWEGLWLSFALAYRIRLLDAEAQRSLQERQQSLMAEQAALKQARDAMAEKNKFLSVFVNIASHELRTPMQSLVAATDLIEISASDSTARSADIRKALERIRSAISKMKLQLRDLAEFSRTSVAAPAPIVCHEPFELSAIAAELKETFGSAASDAGLALHIRVSPIDAPTLLGDPLRILQVASNLVGNSIKYTPSGSIDVELLAPTTSDSHLYLTVRDTGIGIPEQDISRITDAFERGSNLPARSQGKGLGLAVVKSLVEAMRGQLTIESAVGRGTEMRISLPMRLDQVGGPPTVLVIDDELAAEFAKLLSSVGCKVVTAADGYEGVAKAGIQAFDLIILDIQMPGINGTDVARAIRTGEGPSKDCPIAALTAFPNSIPPEDVRKLFSRVCEKPMDRRALRALVADLVPGGISRLDTRADEQA